MFDNETFKITPLPHHPEGDPQRFIINPLPQQPTLSKNEYIALELCRAQAGERGFSYAYTMWEAYEYYLKKLEEKSKNA